MLAHHLRHGPDRHGRNRLLKSNTSKTRTHSLFRQGCMLYELIPNMPEQRLTPLMEKFGETVSSTGFYTAIYCGLKMRGWLSTQRANMFAQSRIECLIEPAAHVDCQLC